MTDSKKTAEDKGGTKTKELQLTKETLKDLKATGSEKVKGGQPTITQYQNGCNS